MKKRNWACFVTLARCWRRLRESARYNRQHDCPARQIAWTGTNRRIHGKRSQLRECGLATNKIKTPKNDGWWNTLKILETWNVFCCCRHGLEFNGASVWEEPAFTESVFFFCRESPLRACEKISKLLTICNHASTPFAKLTIWMHLDMQTSYLISLDRSRNLTTQRSPRPMKPTKKKRMIVITVTLHTLVLESSSSSLSSPSSLLSSTDLEIVV